MEIKDQLQVLLAKQEITDKIYAYCRGMDRIDNDLAKTVWHPDGIVDYGDVFKGSGYEFVEWVAEQHRSLMVTSHQITNILIEIDGETAYSEAYVTMAGIIKNDDKEFEQRVRGRYIDSWSYRDGRWAIDERHFIQDIGTLTDITNTVKMPTSPKSGRDDKSDYSYNVFTKV